MQGCVPVIIHHIDQELQHCRRFCGYFVNVDRDRLCTRVLLSTHVEPLLEHRGQSLPLENKSEAQKVKHHTPETR